MSINTVTTAVPELRDRAVRRRLGVIAGAAVLLIVLLAAWDLLAPWPGLVFLHAAGFQGVSVSAVVHAMGGGVPWDPWLVAAGYFVAAAGGLLAAARGARDAGRATRRVTEGAMLGALAVVGTYTGWQLHQAVDLGHRLHDRLSFTQSSVNQLADRAGIRLDVMVNVTYHDGGGHQVRLPGPVLVVDGFAVGKTIYGYDTVAARAFTAPVIGFAYTGGPR
jgi:hypothetical protein